MGAAGNVRRVVGGVLASALFVTLAVVVPAEARPSSSRAGWSDEQRRQHGEEIAPPLEVTPAIEVGNAPSPNVETREPMPDATPDVVRWPAASTEIVDVAAERFARTGKVRIAAVDAEARFGVRHDQGREGRVRLRVHDRDAATKAGVDGVLVDVAQVAADPTLVPVDVAVDYSGFAEAYGGDWSDRLRLVRLPECALTTPERQECRVQTPLESTNDRASSTVTASVAPASFGVMALAAGTSGSSGNWSATPLSPSAAWQVSGQTGAFAWSYPLRTPPIAGSPQPELALSYSSASLDGKVASTNNQTSWLGDGWDLDGGFIERKYVSCSDDMPGGNNAHRTGDLCWAGDNATMAFAGHSGELVKDAASGTWRLKADDGTRVERLTGGWNDDNDGEYWKVTTTDGTQYFFGRGQRSASDTLQTHAAWSVPVFGNQPGDPCYQADYASSWCNQTWRWNLEYVVDPSGNTMTYVYAKETNNYGRNLNQAVSSYVRGGYLTRIDYGQRAGLEASANAPARVEFAVSERCLAAGSVTCDPAQLSSATAKSWPDVPFDLVCTSSTSCPSQTSPAFFTRKRLTAVTTKVASGSGYQDVDSWNLRHTFPDPGDGTNASLWLAAISHTGRVGTAITLPDVTLHGVQLPNRVDTLGDAGPPMNRYRVVAIDSEAGGKTSINYTPTDCSSNDVPTSPETNTRRCFPVHWQPEGSGPQIMEYFHKYLVDTVIDNPNDMTSASVQTSYRYVGDPAWRFDDNPLVPVSQRTWGQFRGYATVDVLTGAPTGVRSFERTRYFRGMDGDRLSGGAHRSVSVDGIADVDRLNGFVREEVTYDGDGGPEVAAEVTTPWISPPTATAADGTRATYLAPAVSESRTTASALPGGKRTVRTATTYDNTYGRPTQVHDHGDVADPGDDRCTSIEYARNTSLHIVATVSRSETVSVACGAAAARPADVLSDQRTFYDGGAFGAGPTRGLVTQVESLSGYSGGTPQYLTEASTTYDAQGRPVTTTDVMGRVSTTTYTPATGGPVTGTTITAPDPDGSGPLTPSVTNVVLNPAWGTPSKVTDPNGKVTSATSDALGRTTAVWLPGRDQASKSANSTYEYSVSTTAPNTVTTKTLTAAEGYQTSVELFDGLLRPRQTQRPSAARDTPGRIITDTFYDSRGLVDRAHGEWFTNGSPSTSVAIPATAVPSRTRFVYDGVGRATAEITDVAEQEKWRTTTTYGGDRVSVDPPTGGVPQTTITDARGKVLELRDHTGADPSSEYQSALYGYDKAGNLTSVKDAAGNTWSYSYDLRGRQISTTDPDKGTSATTYDNADLVATTTDALGQTLAYVRDQLGRPTELRDTSSTGSLRATWVYDTLEKGQLTSSTRHVGTAKYVTAVTAYDDGYRPLGQSVTIPAADGALAGTYTTNYTYTADGQLKTTKLPAAGGMRAETVTTHYDDLSLPRWMSGGLGWGVYVANTHYDVYGETLRHDLGNTYAFFVNYSYESGTRRLTNTWVERENVTGRDMDQTTAYDQAGNPVSVVDRPTGKPIDAQCFAFDGLQRLSSAWTPGDGNCATSPTASALGGPAPYWLDYTFDAVGNRTSEVSHSSAGTTTRAYTYPAAGTARPHAVSSVQQSGAGGSRSDSYSYDVNGNTVGRNVAGQAEQSLAWDAEGKLQSLAQAGAPAASFVYTADGERLVRRQDGTTTVYLPGGEELTLTTATGAVKATRHYTFNGQNVAVRTGSDNSSVSSLVSDPHATAELAIANVANVVTQRRLDPYGSPRGTASLWPSDRGFLNKPVDSSGLTQVGARYYDASIGRFISVDPVMALDIPQQWAAYSYADNNPISKADPTGMLWKKITESKAWKSSSKFVKKYQGEIVGTLVGVVVTSGCLAATAGSGSIGCMALGGAAAGAATNLWKSKVQKVQPFGWRSLLKDTGVGALGGAVGGAAGKALAPIAGKALAKAAVAGKAAVGKVGGAVGQALSKVVSKSGSSAANGGKAATTAARACSFSAPTLVLMGDGSTRPISQVAVGDEVTATDPETGEQAAKKVLQLFVHIDDLVDLEVDGEVIETTEDHPFWNATDQAFQRADELDAGDRLVAADGQLVTVLTMRPIEDGLTLAFNLAVDDIHTYHVLAGETSVLVHNNCSIASRYEDITSPGARVPNRSTDVGPVEFGKTLESNGFSRTQMGANIMYEKEGVRYFLRGKAKSVSGWTADYYRPGSRKVDLKIRLGEE
ncbi:polymorphic toxin-type HINT domain-containing protein [Cellulomonas chengniuliangii]|uniref:polymorphic toxin-type HINT domain-containing protein n=1 Tax=Cellulomonas chengniuliangii TaxID=2968084 RepID=UPI001D0EF7DB|nr:polymorphic toxin-type HINT domain-containing protein [Cellulomonas chengniuliangii]MCC2319268.1 hypothetical protein [Cellulomonas chengniuliangii]